MKKISTVKQSNTSIHQKFTGINLESQDNHHYPLHLAKKEKIGHITRHITFIFRSF